jgi:hypothetical protein
MEKHGFVYIWYDRKHRRYYVGCHWGKEDDGYICSSPWMKQAYKHRPYDFKRRILKTNIDNRIDMFVEEQKWLDLIKPEEIRVRYYNLNIKNNEIWSKYDEKIKTISEKISIKTKEAMRREDVRENYETGLKKRDTRSSDLEVREKRRQSMIEAMTKKYPNKHQFANAAEKQRYYRARRKMLMGQ